MRQTETSECGLACLAAASETFGSRVDMSTLRQKYQISSRGMTLRDLKEVAADMGMISHAVRCELDELANLTLPAVLHWGANHFVLLLSIRRNRYRISDPAIGQVDHAYAEVSRQFTGVALQLSPAANFIKRKEPSPLSLTSWFRLVPTVYGALTQILVLSILMQLFILVTPLYIQLAVDHAALKGDRQLLSILAWGFGMVCVFNALASFLRGLVALRLSAYLNWDMTTRLFRHMVRLPLPWFQRRKLADILSRYDAILPVRNLLSGALVTILVDGLLAIGTLVMMLILAPWLAGIALAGAAMYVVVRMGGLQLSTRLGMDALTARIGESGKRIEAIRTIQTLKMMGAEARRESDWSNRLSQMIRAETRCGHTSLSFASIQSFIDGAVRIIIIYVGITNVIDGQISVGLFYAFLSYQSQFSSKANALFDQIVNWHMTDMYSFRLADIVLSPVEEGLDTPRSGTPAMLGHVELKNLGFAFGLRDAPVFSGLSLNIEPGEFIAIVGPSGVGKSTLLKVLCGLYPASQGQVLIDGRPLSWWGPVNVRRALGVVMQDDELLAGTVAENVAFFDDSIDMELVWSSLKDAAIFDDIMAMPMRADTLIGDMGSTLSGGQKQRILLARALYRRPSILILDEATSHVDIAKERHINAALCALKITRIVVAHRRETIDAADRIVFLENGRIAAKATA